MTRLITALIAALSIALASNAVASDVYVDRLIFSPDGSTLVGLDSKTQGHNVYIWNTETGFFRLLPHDRRESRRIKDVSISQNGELIAVAMEISDENLSHDTVRVYDMNLLKEQAEISEYIGTIYKIGIVSNGESSKLLIHSLYYIDENNSYRNTITSFSGTYYDTLASKVTVDNPGEIFFRTSFEQAFLFDVATTTFHLLNPTTGAKISSARIKDCRAQKTSIQTHFSRAAIDCFNLTELRLYDMVRADLISAPVVTGKISSMSLLINARKAAVLRGDDDCP